MKGLELCRQYYKDIIEPIIRNNMDFIGGMYAAALIGWGSDVLGNDDELSRDHEWGPRCIIFLPESLMYYSDKVYDILNKNVPIKFKGYSTRFVAHEKCEGIRVPSTDGSGNVHIEITTCKDYFQSNLGVMVPKNDIEWLSIPENRLLEITGGEVFFDGVGELTKLRDFYSRYYPDDVWKFRLAYAWQSIGWDIDLIGLCNDRGDILSSRYCINETIFRIIRLTFLLNRRYAPSYPKWIHREFYKLPFIAKEIGPALEDIYTEKDGKHALQKITDICNKLIDYQNSDGKLPPLQIGQNVFSRGYINIDFQYIAEQIYETIYGELKHIPIDGAVDQWVTNQDFLLDSNRIKALSAIYNS